MHSRCVGFLGILHELWHDSQVVWPIFTDYWVLFMQNAQIDGMSLHLGVSSWLYETWRGVFYPDNMPNREMLSFYAGRFDSVEVNTSFYGLPSPATVLNWVESVPAGFTFTLKFPRAISHEARLVDCAGESLAFLDVLRSLGPAAGVGFLQLPPSFTRRTDGRALAAYVDWLADQLDQPGGDRLRIAVEVRSLDLMTPAFARFLAERGLALALVDRANQPDLFPIWQEVMAEDHAPDFAFIRWIGDDGNPPPDRIQMHRPQDEKLDLWAERLADLLAEGQRVYAYMHNPYEGHSPLSVGRLQERLSARVDLRPWPPTDYEPPLAQMALF